MLMKRRLAVGSVSAVVRNVQRERLIGFRDTCKLQCENDKAPGLR